MSCFIVTSVEDKWKFCPVVFPNGCTTRDNIDIEGSEFNSLAILY